MFKTFESHSLKVRLKMNHSSDKFLSLLNLSRKVTSNDAASLFRVISEQMCDTQIYHPLMRRKCVAYMRRHKNYFKKFIHSNFEQYLERMSLPTTYGTYVELRAMALMFGRNVKLYKSWRVGFYFIQRKYFTHDFLIYEWNKRSFHTLVTITHMTDLSVCQSIMYDILYKDIFQLPDVTLVAEKMLYPERFCDEYQFSVDFDYERGCKAKCVNISDGRCYTLDSPTKTQCILKNPKYCNFHNKNFSNDLNAASDKEKHKFLLKKKYCSCTQQLLMMGRYPFSLKVAKGLLPDSFHNTEMEAFSTKKCSNNEKLMNTNNCKSYCNTNVPQKRSEFTEDPWSPQNNVRCEVFELMELDSIIKLLIYMFLLTFSHLYGFINSE